MAATFDFDDAYEECLDCDGTGYDDDDYPCIYCDGDGVVEHECP